jgi:NAD-dependent dihydropyrimidine dehydrogenase PreA subunit
MENIRIITFSGTGNTRFVVDALVRDLEKRGVQAIAQNMEELLHTSGGISASDNELVGFAYPVHAFNAPPLLENFLRHLPALTKPRMCFLIKSSGSPWAHAGSTSTVNSILAGKNWHVVYEALVPMPSNFVTGYPEDFIKFNLELMLKQADKIAAEMVTRKKSLLPDNLIMQTLSVLMRIEHLGAKFYGRYLKVGDKCTQCGLCARQCPTKNISLKDGKFRFGWHCTLCMRCSFDCPVQAYSHKHMGKLAIIKQPYDLQRILDDPQIKPVEINDKSPSYVKDLRNFYRREGLLP